ncbi:MarR family transcriptional regulator [Actinomadura sp. ATCC 31491]|uniref:MarR family transcriptional regulator n=1 Tax=Actinomadura luzonensis TaxID=2805427 RepID=A0ABT0FYH5_9ACTN|nr:MarR family transcriptional regulator [Actinomadura luzonensis]MCK2217399.1 MarR family transcriptional regulator [Actinomadura luzonensis]
MSRPRRLGYLLKHANLRLTDLTGPALAPYGLDGREFAVLAVIGEPGPLSQLDVGQRLGVDRSTMVGLVDGLERKRLVARRPHPDDRRKNVVELTEHGRETLEKATRAVDEAEAAFLSGLEEGDARLFRVLLERLLG